MKLSPNQRTVFDLVKKHEPVTSNSIKRFTKTLFAREATAIKILAQLEGKCLIENTGQDTWVLVGSDSGVLEAKEGVVETSVKVEEVKEPTLTVKNPEHASNSVSDALEDLKKQLAVVPLEPKQVEQLDLKLDVLTKLADLLDPSISSVLSSIKQDLAELESLSEQSQKAA